MTTSSAGLSTGSQHQMMVPDALGYDFGIGIDPLSGDVKDHVVAGVATPPQQADGSSQGFVVSRVTSIHDLQTSLGIDAQATYGFGAFGGVSAQFSFSESSHIHASSLFMSVAATINLANLSIDDCVLTPTAAAMVDQPEVFAERYGTLFARAVSRGGVFVGLIEVQTYSEDDATKIEASLKGSYGFFSASASTSFKNVCQDSNVSVYCRIYSAGGPKITIKDPSDPSELLQSANDWMSAMHDDPTANARPYQWLLSPLSIVEGPLPPNSADLEHAQDILRTCATARLTLLDQLNQLCWYRDHATHYDWSKSASPTDFARFIADVQTDLDTIASCASGAIDHPAQAVMPSDWAQGHGGTFPTSVPPSIFPEELKSNPVPVPVVLPHWTFGEDIEIGSGDGTIPSASSLGLNVSLDWVVGTGITGTVISMTPKPGDTVMSGSTVFISLVNNPDN